MVVGNDAQRLSSAAPERAARREPKALFALGVGCSDLLGETTMTGRYAGLAGCALR